MRRGNFCCGGSMVWRACGHHIVLYDWLATLEAAFCCQGFCLPPTLEVVLSRIASFVSSYPPGVGVAPSAYGARKLPPATHLGGPRLWQRYNCPTTTTVKPFCRYVDYALMFKYIFVSAGPCATAAAKSPQHCFSFSHSSSECVAYSWSLAARVRNKIIHATHGNGGEEGPGPPVANAQRESKALGDLV